MNLDELHSDLKEKNQILLDYLKRQPSVITVAKNIHEVYERIKERKELYKKESDVLEVVNRIRQSQYLSQINNPFSEKRFEPSRIKDSISTAILSLAEYGWYFNYEFSTIDIVEAYKLYKKNAIGELDEFMSTEMRKQLPNIKTTLIERHIDRKEPIDAAFRAHEMKEYYLSVPVLFAQADGISKDLSRFNFFLTNNKKQDFSPKVSEWAKTEPKIWIHVALCAALLEKGAFQLHHSEPNKLNFTRHSVMHGENNDYGTEINSLKAISLLIYISDVMSPRKVESP